MVMSKSVGELIKKYATLEVLDAEEISLCNRVPIIVMLLISKPVLIISWRLW